MRHLIEHIHTICLNLKHESLIDNYHIDYTDSHFVKIHLDDEQVVLRYSYIGLDDLSDDSLYHVIRYDVLEQQSDYALAELKSMF
jgi:hypothetical protein